MLLETLQAVFRDGRLLLASSCSYPDDLVRLVSTTFMSVWKDRLCLVQLPKFVASVTVTSAEELRANTISGGHISSIVLARCPQPCLQFAS